MSRQKHRAVKATPDEADYDLPKELDFEKLRPVGFGIGTLDAFERVHRRTVELDSDVAKVFKDSRAVNEVLRAIIGSMPAQRRRPA